MVKAVARPVLRRILLGHRGDRGRRVVNDDCVVLGLAAAVTVEGALDVVVESSWSFLQSSRLSCYSW